MRNFVVTVIAVLIIALLLPAAAQRSRRRGNTTNTAAAPVNEKDSGRVVITLGKSALTSGPVSKAIFDSFAYQGLFPARGTVATFTFIYGERNLYEDSVGNPLLVTDLLTEYCYGPQLTAGIKETLLDRTKPGDTAYFEDIRIVMPNGSTGYGRNMKFVLTR